MADGIFDVLSSTQQMQANYEKYKDMFKDNTAELVNSETFLNLLVAEMTHQDPLEPTSNTEFITQMAQMSQLQYLQDSSKYSMANYAATLVGKTVTASKMDGGELVTKTGVVSDVRKNGDTFTVMIDGVGFDIEKITAVTETAADSSSDLSASNQLGDMISRASLMIGMYATVKTAAANGSFVDAGLIDSIQVKDGVISANINGTAYNLSDIIEVSYAKIDAGDSAEEAAETGAVEEVEENEEYVDEEYEEDIEDLEDIEDEF